MSWTNQYVQLIQSYWLTVKVIIEYILFGNHMKQNLEKEPMKREIYQGNMKGRWFLTVLGKNYTTYSSLIESTWIK